MLLVMEQAIPSNEESEELLFCVRFGKFHHKNIQCNEKFYGYDDGFGIRIKQRFSAIIRRHLWWKASSLRVISLEEKFLFRQCKHGR